MLKNKVPWLQTSLLLTLTINLTTISLLPIQPSLAETTSVPSPSDAPLELELLTKPKGSIITANTIDPKKLTIPSLWLIKANLEENKLLNNWIAYPSAKSEPARRVDLIVNQQVWSLFDYLERYDFVNRFGTAVRNEGYNLRVFNSQEELLATYTCHFDIEKALCSIQMNAQNKLGLQHSLEKK